MAGLTREEILAAEDIKTEVVPVPEWGGEVTVKALTGTERDDFEASIVLFRRDGNAVPNMSNVRAKLLQKSVINGSGELMFSEVDIEALGKKSAAALQRVWEASRKLSRLTQEDVGELLGNSEEGQSDSST